jgi:hypothetical protein
MLILIACGTVLAGCQPQGPQWQTAVVPSVDYAEVFQAARSVLAEDYTIARADPLTGVIETEPLPFQKTGSERAVGAYLSSGDAQNYRRRATCRVERGTGGAVVIGVRADIEREGTNQAEALLIGTEGGDRRQAGAQRRWEYGDQRTAAYWADIGRDEEVERQLIERIRQRLEMLPSEKTGGGPA